MESILFMAFKTDDYFKIIHDDAHHFPDTDYEVYLNTRQLLSCQKQFSDFCNGAELQFQIVHQTEELLLKLMSYTIVQICDYIQQKETYQVLNLFKRVHSSQNILIQILSLLGTMSPKEYQQIRLVLGNGSGQTSPGFRALRHAIKPMWQLYETNYLINGKTLDHIYNSHYTHDDAYAIAESMIEFDMLLARFYKMHFELVERTIGGKARALTGRNAEKLRAHEDYKVFPALWSIRNKMTDEWGSQYGYERQSMVEENIM